MLKPKKTECYCVPIYVPVVYIFIWILLLLMYQLRSASSANKNEPVGICPGCPKTTTPPPTTVTPTLSPLDAALGKFKTTTTITIRRKRTTASYFVFDEICDYQGVICLRVFRTEPVCGRTKYYHYKTFPNYCLLEYVNCMERFKVYQIARMGNCTEFKTLDNYTQYDYEDESYLKHDYIIQES